MCVLGLMQPASATCLALCTPETCATRIAGAGKSSMLNAVLGEVNVLPTNGMRACTATITEVSYADIPG